MCTLGYKNLALKKSIFGEKVAHPNNDCKNFIKSFSNTHPRFGIRKTTSELPTIVILVGGALAKESCLCKLTSCI